MNTSHSSSSSHTGRSRFIHKALFLHLPILFALYILTDNDTYWDDDDNDDDVSISDGIHVHHRNRHHLAVFTALQRHPPSARIFRCLLEFVLLGLCMSWSIYVWESVVGKDVLGRLMFDTPYTLTNINDRDEDDDDGAMSAESAMIPTEVEMVSFLNNNSGDSKNSNCEDDPSLSAQTALTDDNKIHGDDDCHVRSPIPKRDKKTRAPKALYVFNASLDILLLILVTLFLFTITSSAGGTYIDQAKSQSILSHVGVIAARTFPLLLFVYLTLRCLLPWTRTKKYIWTILGYTFGAPAYKVTFRDGMVGDILTSMVRPMQDLAYTFFYLAMGLQGWFTVRNDPDDPHLDHRQPAVEGSWLLHTVLLPALALSPLWWRFCQCLRQTYVSRTRWPYLGNAAKYFVAAQVAAVAVYDPVMRETLGWKVAAVGATLYQIWWDVFMDWELLEVVVEAEERVGSRGYSMTNTETVSANRWFPFVKLQLRRQRLYQSTSMYVGIAIINVVLRFGWTLTFIPDWYLSSSSGILMESFTGLGADMREMVGPGLAAAEILRRTLWGFFRLELEALKVDKEQQPPLSIERHCRQGYKDGLKKSVLEMEGDAIEMEPMSISSSVKSSSSKMTFLWNDMSASSDVHVLWELCFYATAFTSLGIIAAYHRQVY